MDTTTSTTRYRVLRTCSAIGWGTNGAKYAGCAHFASASGSGPSHWFAWPPAGYVPSGYETEMDWWHVDVGADAGSWQFPTGSTVKVKHLWTGLEEPLVQQQFHPGRLAFKFAKPRTSWGAHQVTVLRANGTPLHQYVVQFVSCP